MDKHTPGFKHPEFNSPKNWVDMDADVENVYAHKCYECGHGFFAIGRHCYICKECSDINVERSRMADEYPLLLEQNRVMKEALEKIVNTFPIGGYQVQELQSIAKQALTIKTDIK